MRLFSFLQGSKKIYNKTPDVYVTFLNILREFSSKRLSVPLVRTQVCTLFADQPSLIEGFNVFLPKDQRIEVQLKKKESPVSHGIPNILASQLPPLPKFDVDQPSSTPKPPEESLFVNDQSIQMSDVNMSTFTPTTPQKKPISKLDQLCAECERLATRISGDCNELFNKTLKSCDEVSRATSQACESLVNKSSSYSINNQELSDSTILQCSDLSGQTLKSCNDRWDQVFKQADPLSNKVVESCKEYSQQVDLMCSQLYDQEMKDLESSQLKEQDLSNKVIQDCAKLSASTFAMCQDLSSSINQQMNALHDSITSSILSL